MPPLTNRHVRRELNAAVRELDGGARGPAETVSLMCECGRGGCLERLDVPVADFDDAAAIEGWFIVAAGHEPKDDRPLRAEVGYSIVGPKSLDAETEREPLPLRNVAPGFAG